MMSENFKRMIRPGLIRAVIGSAMWIGVCLAAWHYCDPYDTVPRIMLGGVALISAVIPVYLILSF